MAELYLTARPNVTAFRMVIDDPVPPLAANMLAASGLFDIIHIVGTASGSDDIHLEGRELLRAALVVWGPVNDGLLKAKAERESQA